MPAVDFRHFLKNGKAVLLLDGATGSNFFKRGLPTGYPPELWNMENPQAVAELAADFLDAGSQLLLTNTFGAHPLRLEMHDAQQHCRAINMAAVKLARQAGGRHFVAGSIGPLGAVLREEGGSLDADTGFGSFCQQVDALIAAGVDCLWLETLSSSRELALAVKACRRHDVPVCATMSFDTHGRTMMGVTPASMLEQARDLRLDAVGMNCGSSLADSMATIRLLVRYNKTAIPLIAKANCGVPRYHDGQIIYDVTAETMGCYMTAARVAGVRLIGGCCGTTPGHIRQMSRAEPAMSGADWTVAEIERDFGKISEGNMRMLVHSQPAPAKRSRRPRPAGISA